MEILKKKLTKIKLVEDCSDWEHFLTHTRPILIEKSLVRMNIKAHGTKYYRFF